MKQFGILAMVCLLTATLFTGCRAPEPGTTGATNNNPSSSSSTVRPDPSVTTPGSSTTPGGTDASGGQRNIQPMA